MTLSIQPKSVGKILGDPICNCGLDCASLWTRRFVLSMRTHLFDCCKSRQDLLKFLFTVLSVMYDSETDKFIYKVNNILCCGIAFERFWNITNYTRRHVTYCIRNNLPVTVPHGNSIREHLQFKTGLVIVWLSNFCLLCEQQSDSNEVHTVERYKKVDIYDVMISEMHYSYSKADLPSLNLFYQVWKKNFQHLKIPQECRLGRCDDFWCVQGASVESSSFSSGDDDPNTDDERDVHVLNHPRFIDHSDLRKGVIVAVRPYDNHYDENPDETPVAFWLAKIISHRQRGHNWFYKVCWFNDVTIDDPNVPSKYILDESTTATIPYGSILYHNIELTQRNNLRLNIYNKIITICNEK